MKNPYEVLGIEETATDAQVKSAYRDLVKQFHPDKYQNNPLADLAEEKMKDINIAYDAIVKMRSQGTSGTSSQTGQYQQGNYTGAQQGARGQYYQSKQGSPLGMRIRSFIQLGDLVSAQKLLDEMPEKNGEWYYLMAALSYKKGFLMEAQEHSLQACRLDPQNLEYRQLYDSLQFQSSRGFGGFGNSGCDCCNICNIIMCTSCCC